MKTSRFVSVIVLSAAFATPAFANYFSNPNLGMNANVGSAPSPRPADLRTDRWMPSFAHATPQKHLVQVAVSLPRTYSTDAVEGPPRMRASMPKSDESGGFFSWLFDWSTPAPAMSAPAPAPKVESDGGSGGFFSGLFDWLPL
jgi:hypothetical protein